MKYIVTEGKFDSFVISNLFKDEIKDNFWKAVPIGGGLSEAISLAESLAYRHNDGKILLIVDSDGDIDENNFNIKRIKSRLDEYENIQIVFSVPNIENEIIKIMDFGINLQDPLILKTKSLKQNIQKNTKIIFSKSNSKINETSYYKDIKKVLSA